MKKSLILITLVALAPFTMAENRGKFKITNDSIRKEVIIKLDKLEHESYIVPGFVFDIHGAGGISGLHMPKSDEVKSGLGYPSWNAGIGLQYFFHKNVGISTGVDFDMLYGYTDLNGSWEKNGIDADGDSYIFRSTAHEFHESEQIGYLGVPVLLRVRSMSANNKIGVNFAAGVKFAFPMYNRYRTTSGSELKNEVYYPDYDLLIKNVPSMVEDVEVGGIADKVYSSYLNRVSYMLYGELGMIIPMNLCSNFNISIYGQYGLNNGRSSQEGQPIGWKEQMDEAGLVYAHPFEGNYPGILASDKGTTIHPWSAGIKIGIEINTARCAAQRKYNELAESLYLYDLTREEKQEEEVENPQPIVEPIEEIAIEPDTIVVVAEVEEPNAEIQIEAETIVTEAEPEIHIATEEVPAEKKTIVKTTGVYEKVRKGSRLAQIARRHYGDAELWPIIYEANKDIIKNPDLIYKNMKLFIPDIE